MNEKEAADSPEANSPSKFRPKTQAERDERPNDPTEPARKWLAENPQAPGARHVAEMIASAERYRLLAQEAEGLTGSKIVIVSATGTSYTFTTTTYLSDFGVAMAATYAILQANGYSDDEATSAVRAATKSDVRVLTAATEAVEVLGVVQRALAGEKIVGRHVNDPVVVAAVAMAAATKAVTRPAGDEP